MDVRYRCTGSATRTMKDTTQMKVRNLMARRYTMRCNANVQELRWDNALVKLDIFADYGIKAVRI